MNRVQPLVRTDAVTLERFDHVPGVAHHDPDREVAGGHAVSLVEHGAFRVRTRGRWHDVGAGQLLLTRPGLEFSCAHHTECPDDCCLTVSYAEAAHESLRGTGARPPRALVAPLTNRRAYLLQALRACGSGDPARTEALAGALYWTLGATPAPSAPLFSATQLSWYAQRIDRAVEHMAHHFAEPLALSTLAREAGMSVFHFARVFAELRGQTPHRHLTAVRLARAQARLRAGDAVTATCFAVGFGSLSHFIATYRRHFGMRPSDARTR